MALMTIISLLEHHILKNYHFILLLSLLTWLSACAEKTNATPKTTPKLVQKTVNISVIKRGEALDSAKASLTLDNISSDPEKFSGKQVIVEGEITAVCQAKGCWMTMAGKSATARARVTFKDYAFFVPKDVKGKKIKLKGEVKVKLLSDKERAHLAEDGRVDISQIPKAELRLVASGVEIYS